MSRSSDDESATQSPPVSQEQAVPSNHDSDGEGRSARSLAGRDAGSDREHEVPEDDAFDGSDQRRGERVVEGDGPRDRKIHEGSVQDPLSQEIVGPTPSTRETVYRSGPLPDPEEFAEYERTLPGAADRILTMAEDAASARNSSLTWLSLAEAVSVTFVSIVVALSPLLLTAGAIWLALAGHETGATVVAIGAVVSAGPKLIAAIKGNPIGDDRAEDDEQA